MPGVIINDLPVVVKPPGLDFFWLPGGAPGDPTYAYPDGADSGARKCPSNRPVQFTAVVGTRPGVSVVSYEWDFGDGTKARGNQVTRTFQTTNRHQRVSLCVTDTNGVRQCCGHQLYLTDGGAAGLPVFPQSVLYPSPGLYPRAPSSTSVFAAYPVGTLYPADNLFVNT